VRGGRSRVDDVAQQVERLEGHRVGKDPPAPDGLVPAVSPSASTTLVMPRGRTAKPPLAKAA